MCPDFWRRMTGKHGLAHGDVAEEVGLELLAEFAERQVFAKAGDAESGIVDQHVDAAVVAHDAVDHARRWSRIQ